MVYALHLLPYVMGGTSYVYLLGIVLWSVSARAAEGHRNGGEAAESGAAGEYSRSGDVRPLNEQTRPAPAPAPRPLNAFARSPAAATKARKAIAESQVGNKPYSFGADFPCLVRYHECTNTHYWRYPTNFQYGDVTAHPSAYYCAQAQDCQSYYSTCVDYYAGLPKNSCHDFAFSFCKEMETRGVASWIVHWRGSWPASSMFHTQNIVLDDSNPRRMCLIEPQNARGGMQIDDKFCWPEKYDKNNLPVLPPGMHYAGLGGVAEKCDLNFFATCRERPGQEALQSAKLKPDERLMQGLAVGPDGNAPLNNKIQ